MKKLLIIKTGTTFPSIRQLHGDFDDFIINQIDLPPEKVIVAPIYLDKNLPELKDVSGIVITGSHSMVTDCDGWSIFLAQWLREAANNSIPILGICYGHQLLAQAFAGKVDYHPKGKEIGTVKIELTEVGREDPLLGVLPKNFWGHVTHSQTAVKIPANARLLARNEFEPHHAFVLGENIWGVQFHPEFNADIIKLYIKEQERGLLEEGYNLDLINNSVQEHDYGKILLKRFTELMDKQR